MKRRWKILLGSGGALLVAALVPIVYVETQCAAPLAGINAGPAFRSQLPGAAGRRPEAQTWLTYPEWSIVYSAETYGRYLAAGNRPSGFSHWREVRGFWSGLCAVNRASAAAGGSGDYKVMLYTIGLSFSAEMLVKAAYENTLGRLFEWIGGADSADDRYNAETWQRYGAFMHQTPWYAFPFGQTLAGLWRTDGTGHQIRHWERRFALTIEYGVKAGYAALIGWASGATLGRDELSLRFVATADPAVIRVVDPRFRPVARLADGRIAVEAPRYEQFTELMLRLARTPVQLSEIAGNDEIFVTIRERADGPTPPGTMFMLPLRDRQGWRRTGLTVPVTELLPLLRAVETRGGEVEHVYDY